MSGAKIDLEGALVATSLTLDDDMMAGDVGCGSALTLTLDLKLRGNAGKALAHPMREAFMSRIAVSVDDIQMRQLLNLLGIKLPEGV